MARYSPTFGARAAGWTQEESGWWTHPTYGGVCKEAGGTWYHYGPDSTSGPHPTMTRAMYEAMRGALTLDPTERALSDETAEEMCGACGVREATEPHPCPYRAEIHDDSESLCTCCDECEQECAWDI